jgi:diguanylate cyclase (GGDEF)-like protein
MNHTLSHIEQVARLTHAKDRDTTDAVLVEVLFSLLQPEAVTLVEVVPGADGRRSVVRGHQNASLVAPVSTPPWTTLEECPLLADEPWRAHVADTLQSHVDATASGAERLVVPITTDTETLLLLEVVAPSPLRADACSVVEGFAKIYKNFLNLLDYSERDTLTSLLNRKSFDETFFKATQVRVPVYTGVSHGDKRIASMAHGYWLGVIDIDHFKRVNDGFGHLIGDEVLLLVARIMRSTFRHEDRLYRFGGEEFVVLLRAQDEAAAHAVFERFREHIEAYRFPQVGTITVSIGHTRVLRNDTPSSAFERADKVVYMAKSQGRNQVICYERQVSPETDTGPVRHNVVELF